MFYSLYCSCIELCGSHSQRLGPLHSDSDVGLYKVISEFLIGRLGAHDLFSEIGGDQRK